MAPKTKFRINGRDYEVDSAFRGTLLGLLRVELGLMGTKYGCGEGRCGACTVLIDGTAKRSCVLDARSVAGREITTIEGLEKDGQLHAVQQAFIDAQAFQCGYCTSGMIMAGVALLRKSPHPSLEEIIDAMNGNVCRCGTYPRVLKAMQSAAGKKEEVRS